MDLRNSSILVTGAGGFIGSHLVEKLLQSDANVRAFVRYTASGNVGNLDYLKPFPDNLEIVYGDLQNPEAVTHAMKDVDCVFHLASLVSIPYSYVHPREYFNNNVSFIINILEAAKELGTESIIHTSTSEVYGTAETVPISESHPLKGQSPYSASKISADMVAYSYFRSFDSPVVTIRPFNTYGPRQSVRAVIPTIISQALFNDVIFLGDVRPTRDFNYVGDTVSGMIAAATKGKSVFGEVINLGTGIEITIEEIANQIIKATGSPAKIVFNATKVRPSKSEVFRLCADASKARKLLGWESKIGIDEGIERTIEWFKELPPTANQIDSFV
ncbi:MAG: GDP-mannose 4,6-dehydratase [Candidatus Thorarchaeota archaeon]